jgi:hypothetical protein
MPLTINERGKYNIPAKSRPYHLWMLFEERSDHLEFNQGIGN